jgi:hypothetical protein
VRHKGLLCFAVIAATALLPTEAPAALVISTGANRNVSCSQGVCSAQRANAVLNVSTLQGLLQSSSVVVRPGSVASDVAVVSGVSWTSSNALTLDSYRAIAINAPVAITGQGGLGLTTNDGGTNGTLTFGSQGNVNFWSMTSKLTINGAAYTLVNSIASLAQAAAASQYGNFALANNYNAAQDGTYSATPVPYIGGIFEGLGNTISNFSIHVTYYTGGAAALLSQVYIANDVRMTNVKVAQTGAYTVGGLAAVASYLSGDTVTGVLSTGAGTVFGQSSAGGLAGYLKFPGIAVNCSSSATVSGGAGSAVGGLIGIDEGGENALVQNSFATGAVTVASGSSKNTSMAGGLIGANDTTVDASVVSSYATGSVTAGNWAEIGGLVGLDFGSAIKTSYSTGKVTGGSNVSVGGLAGEILEDEIVGSYATGSVVGGTSSNVGGLAGWQYATSISTSHATGSVSGNNGSNVGGISGLVGSPNGYLDSITQSWASGTVAGGASTSVGGIAGYVSAIGAQSVGPPPNIANSYASGETSTGNAGYVGGLIGTIQSATIAAYSPTVSDSYAAGKVVGQGNSVIGGFAGFAQTYSGTNIIADTYWDTTTSGITNLQQGVGSKPGYPGVSGLTTTQLQAGLPPGFSNAVWSESAGINGGLPYLSALPPAQHDPKNASPGTVPHAGRSGVGENREAK